MRGDVEGCGEGKMKGLPYNGVVKRHHQIEQFDTCRELNLAIAYYTCVFGFSVKESVT